MGWEYGEGLEIILGCMFYSRLSLEGRLESQSYLCIPYTFFFLFFPPVCCDVHLLRQLPPKPGDWWNLLGSDRPVGQPQHKAYSSAEDPTLSSCSHCKIHI